MRFRIKVIGHDTADQETDNPSAAKLEAFTMAQIFKNRTVAVFDRESDLVYYMSCSSIYKARDE